MSVNSFKSGEVNDVAPTEKKKKKKSKSNAEATIDDADNADSSSPTDLNHISMQLAQVITGISHLNARVDTVEAHVGSSMRAQGKPTNGCGLPEALPESGKPERAAAPTSPAGYEEAGDVRAGRTRGAPSNANANFSRGQPFNTVSPNVQAAQPFPFDIGHFAEDNPFPRPRTAEAQVYAYNLRDDGRSADLVEGLRRAKSGQAIFEVRNLVPMLSYLHDLSIYADECAAQAVADDPEAAAQFAQLRDGIDSVFEFGHERLDEVQIRNEEPKATGLHEWIASRYDVDNRARSSRFVRRAREAHDSAVLGQVVKQGAATEGARVLYANGAKAPPKPPAGAHGADESDDEGRDKGKGKGKRAQRATRQH